MSIDMTRRAFTIEGIDSGALMFDSYGAAIRFLQLHLGVDTDWTADDIPAGMPTSLKFHLKPEPYTPAKPQEYRVKLKDRLGDSEEYTFRAYTLVSDETVEPAFQWLKSKS